jgi:hypothetical protein
MYKPVEKIIREVLNGRTGSRVVTSMEHAIRKILEAKSHKDKTYVEKDFRDQVSTGSYKTQHFEMEPQAQKLYAQNLPKDVDTAMAERAMIDQDKLFGIHKSVKGKQRATDADVTEAEKLAQNVKGFAKKLNLEKEHGYLDDHVNAIRKLLDPKGSEPVEADRFEMEKTKRFASKPYDPTKEPPDRDSDNDKFRLSRGIKIQRKLKIIDND